MPEPWKLTRAGDGVYSLHIGTHYRGYVRRRAYGPGPWVLKRKGDRDGQECGAFATIKEVKAWIGEHLEELTKGESVDA